MALIKSERVEHVKQLRKPTARAVATVLTRARLDKGWTQRELAVALKRHHSVVAAIESHARQVNLAEFIVIADALGRDPEDLFQQVLRERRRQ